MAGIKVSFVSDIEPRLAGLVKNVENPAPLHAQIVEYLHRTTRDRFKTQTAPDGTAWAPLTPSYLQRKRRNANKILIYRGYLVGTLRGQSDRKGLVFGSDRKYAARQHYGGGGIVAREILGTNKQQDQHIVNLGQSFLKKPLL